ncbi:toxin-antitoxin system YwqK family antitoxin [Ramlibacter albus]|uniref:Toxin-antitoxin system YwqK family antitoxin n=1 Tax=Ramlibacter albus TaxID=2079448 RepID=A0A923S378_9BURK|nr:hypothetical protein [Ramlibacter albus]MBC5766160.1 hypothetical protein [Ramlibacter albus]
MRRAALPLLLLLACNAHAVQDCDIGGVGVNPANGATTEGKTGIMRCVDRDTRVVQREQELRGGRFIGLVRFYDNGKLAKEHSVNERGNLQGRGREFGPQGQVLFEGEYDNGDLKGISRRFHANGQLRGITVHAPRGEPAAAASFNAQGQLTELRCGARPQLAPAVDDARLCGFGSPSSVDLYNERGVLQFKVNLQDGLRTRVARLDEQGRVRQQEDIDPAKQSRRLQQFADSGTLVRDQRWEAGLPVLDVQHYLNGQPRTKTEWKGSQIVETGYGDDGRVTTTGTWVSARGGRQPTGTHQRFNAAGRLVGESTYDERGRITREKAWDDGGTLLRDDAVFEDGSRKAFSR